MPTAETASYNASCNPPRKAKRPRTDAEITPPQASQPQQQRPRPPILPRDLHQPERESSDGDEDEEDDYDPVSPPPAASTKRRGRKPGPLSRSARESQRKLNHSRIEKARRTKINETLATLSNLVSEAERQRGGIPEVEERARKGEKEFKLDVLVKTVTYIQELMHKVNILESRTCARCSASNGPSPMMSPESPARKRKASDLDIDVDVISVVDDEVDMPESPLSPLPPPVKPVRASPSIRAQSKAPSQSPCLPPISSWLPNPYVDPSCLSTLPSPNPNGPPSHLPTPPLSGSFRVPLSLGSSAPPALVLPGPAHPLPMSSPSIAAETSRMHISMPKRRMSSAHTASLSPTVSPSWTPEDETAASLLLSMSSSPSGSSTSARLRGNSLESNGARPKLDLSMTPMHAETPSSLLGLGRHG
ncbi:BHLH domain-containing protein [Phanerochaete sordida]|uniref:BHLH domain-containing protein n=1 Tax=Phanerochaete sordida TaxID=48140 RepID=A0A9P3G155_9APHY|nr:BHLH domain-containing protein [Phanerochaete sordida]